MIISSAVCVPGSILGGGCPTNKTKPSVLGELASWSAGAHDRTAQKVLSAAEKRTSGEWEERAGGVSGPFNQPWLKRPESEGASPAGICGKGFPNSKDSKCKGPGAGK